jgi:hypothetical protein
MSIEVSFKDGHVQTYSADFACCEPGNFILLRGEPGNRVEVFSAPSELIKNYRTIKLEARPTRGTCELKPRSVSR